MNTTNEHMNKVIRQRNSNLKTDYSNVVFRYINGVLRPIPAKLIDDVVFQTDQYGKNIEQRDKEKIETFKKILRTKQDYNGFKYKDISAPIILKREKRDNKWIMYDGQHRYIAYKQLGYKKIPFKWKDELTDKEWKHLKDFA